MTRGGGMNYFVGESIKFQTIFNRLLMHNCNGEKPILFRGLSRFIAVTFM
jgi:hypothetical protein